MNNVKKQKRIKFEKRTKIRTEKCKKEKYSIEKYYKKFNLENPMKDEKFKIRFSAQCMFKSKV